jgi:hypothetical protein
MHTILLLLILFNGGVLDPNGGQARDRFVRVRALDNGDGRSVIDPIGRVRTQGDRGAGLDPDGAARTTAAGDHRCTIDPNGLCVDR